MEYDDAICFDLAGVSCGLLLYSSRDFLSATHGPGACDSRFVRRILAPETYPEASFFRQEQRYQPLIPCNRDATVSKSQSKENIEVEHCTPIVVSKEDAILRIGNVRVHLERVEVVGQITDCTRKAHCVFRVHLNVFRNSQVEREISGEAILRTVGCGYVLLECVGRLVGKTVTQLHMWRHHDLSWKCV